MTAHLQGLADLLDERRRRAEADAERFTSLDSDECQLCLAHGADKRSLYVACFYAVDEVIPEAIDLSAVPVYEKRGYYLRICKACRGRFLTMLGGWRANCLAMRPFEKDHDGNPEEYDPSATFRSA